MDTIVLSSSSDPSLKKKLKFYFHSTMGGSVSTYVKKGMCATVLAACYVKIVGVSGKRWISSKPEELLAALYRLNPVFNKGFERSQTKKIRKWFLKKLQPHTEEPYPIPCFGVLEYLRPNFKLRSLKFKYETFDVVALSD